MTSCSCDALLLSITLLYKATIALDLIQIKN
ncbi:hypothetical protein [Caudoviricetes sp.]|nr:hypothetical protein [Caudoviricetes sp.]